jgi:hypothetical protein
MCCYDQGCVLFLYASMAFHGPWQGALHGKQGTRMLISLINTVQVALFLPLYMALFY